MFNCNVSPCKSKMQNAKNAKQNAKNAKQNAKTHVVPCFIATISPCRKMHVRIKPYLLSGHRALMRRMRSKMRRMRSKMRKRMMLILTFNGRLECQTFSLLKTTHTRGSELFDFYLLNICHSKIIIANLINCAIVHFIIRSFLSTTDLQQRLVVLPIIQQSL